MAFDSQTISMAVAIVALCMTIYLYRKTSTEIQSLKTRRPILQMAPMPGGLIPDAKPEKEKSSEDVKEEEDEA